MRNQMKLVRQHALDMFFLGQFKGYHVVGLVMFPRIPALSVQGIAPFGQDICLLACSSSAKVEPRPEAPSSGAAKNGQEGDQAGTQRPEVRSQMPWRQCELY